MEIRHELPEDHQAIHQLTADAFAPKSFSDGTEPDVIDALRKADDLSLSLVAVIDDVIIGHVAFSAVSIGALTNDWYGLGPVSVQPERQRSGIGSSLINEGLRILRNKNTDGCALIGDPNFYHRFGFVSDGNVKYKNLPTRHVQWLSFGSIRPIGELQFKPAFDDE